MNFLLFPVIKYKLFFLFIHYPLYQKRMSFSTRPAEWYIEQFEKKGFKLMNHDYTIDSSHKIPEKQSFIELRLTD